LVGWTAGHLEEVVEAVSACLSLAFQSMQHITFIHEPYLTQGLALSRNLQRFHHLPYTYLSRMASALAIGIGVATAAFLVRPLHPAASYLY
jgi:hypothetical protein